MTTSKRVMVCLGLLLSVSVAEVTLRLGDAAIPGTMVWPSVESHLKSDQLSKLSGDIEVVFLGSSVTEAAVDPGYLIDLGAVDSAYNGALPFSTPASNAVWLREVVLPAVEPDLVVIGLPIWPANDDQVSALEVGIQTAANTDKSLLLGWSALWRHRGILGSLDALLIRKQLMEAGVIDELGHQTAYYDAGELTMADSLGPYGRSGMSPRQVSALRSMVELARLKGAEVVLLLEPGRYTAGVPEFAISQYIEWLRAQASELEVPLWDTYSRHWEPGLYADENHFNRLGTRRYTEHVAVLIESYLTADESVRLQRSPPSKD